MAPGDWVNTYYSGVWQIHRVLLVKWEMRFDLQMPRRRSNRTIVFGRRLVNAKWRRSFKTACWGKDQARALSREDRERLDGLWESDASLRGAFERYVPEPVDLVVNLTMGIPDRNGLESFCADTLAPAMVSGVSMEQVLAMLDAAGLTQFLQKYPTRATLQMVSRDHEVTGDEFVLRECRVLPF